MTHFISRAAIITLLALSMLVGTAEAQIFGGLRRDPQQSIWPKQKSARPNSSPTAKSCSTTQSLESAGTTTDFR